MTAAPRSHIGASRAPTGSAERAETAVLRKLHDEFTNCSPVAQQLGASRQDAPTGRGFSPHRGRPPVAPRRDRRAQALSRTRIPFDVRVLRGGVEILRGCRLQSHPGSARSAANSRRHRCDALRAGAPGRAASARAPSHGRKPSRGARGGGGQVEARHRRAGRSTLAAAPRGDGGPKASRSSRPSFGSAARPCSGCNGRPVDETRGPSSTHRATDRGDVQDPVHRRPPIPGQAAPGSGPVAAPRSRRSPGIHLRQGPRPADQAGEERTIRDRPEASAGVDRTCGRTPFAPHPGCDQAHGLRARRWVLHVHRRGWPEVPGDRCPGIRSRRRIRQDASAPGRSDPAALPCAQPARRGKNLREGVHGTSPVIAHLNSSRASPQPRLL